MENIVIKGRISATSNKVDDKFRQEQPTKTAYVTVTDPKDIDNLKKFGLTQYSSKEDQSSFFIIKLPKQVAIYVSGVSKQEPEKMSGGIDTPNFSTPEGKELSLNIIKGENMGRDFFRLQAIQIEDANDIIEVEQTNPFA